MLHTGSSCHWGRLCRICNGLQSHSPSQESRVASLAAMGLAAMGLAAIGLAAAMGLAAMAT